MAERNRVWAAIAVVVAIVAGALALTGCGSGGASYEDQVAADAKAPQSLVKAADELGFHQTTDPGSGQIERLPAEAAAPPRSKLLLDAGDPAPDFELETPQGEKVSLKDLRGKAALLEFFATWCGLCHTEAPHVLAIAKSMDPKKYAFVAINADGEDDASVFAFHRFYKLPYPALLDPGAHPGSFNKPGEPGPTSQEYGMKSLPTFYVIDPKGNVSWRSDGEQPDDKLRLELERAAQ